MDEGCSGTVARQFVHHHHDGRHLLRKQPTLFSASSLGRRVHEETRQRFNGRRAVGPLSEALKSRGQDHAGDFRVELQKLLGCERHALEHAHERAILDQVFVF